MQRELSDKELEYIRKKYPHGTRVELQKMNDVNAPPIGTLGTVDYVDDIGSLCVNWDNGSTLSVIYKVDKVRKVYNMAKDSAERMREFRKRSRENGMKEVLIAIPNEYRIKLNNIRLSHNKTLAKTVCMLIDQYYDNDKNCECVAQ